MLGVPPIFHKPWSTWGWHYPFKVGESSSMGFHPDITCDLFWKMCSVVYNERLRRICYADVLVRENSWLKHHGVYSFIYVYMFIHDCILKWCPAKPAFSLHQFWESIDVGCRKISYTCGGKKGWSFMKTTSLMGNALVQNWVIMVLNAYCCGDWWWLALTNFVHADNTQGWHNQVIKGSKT